MYGLFQSNADSFYYFLIVLTTLYKWWWDVVVDWGLFSSLWNHGHFFDPVDESQLRPMPFLRPVLFFGDWRIYYFCIVADLVLRFLWVISLAPPTFTSGFVLPALQIFLGSLEIIRRAGWGILRVEHEHVKLLHNNVLGLKIKSMGVKSHTRSHSMANVLLNADSSNVAVDENNSNNDRPDIPSEYLPEEENSSFDENSSNNDAKPLQLVSANEWSTDTDNYEDDLVVFHV